MHEVPKLRNPVLFKQKNFIDGHWVDSVSGRAFSVIGKHARGDLLARIQY